MKIIIFVCFILIFYLPIQKKHVNSQQQGIDSDDGDAESFFNKSYSEHQSALEQKIFRGYNPKNRPMKNASFPTIVDVHWHIIHVSINQREQTMTVHGHIYMRWFDEFLVWDPKDFNNIQYARVKKWQVWQPKIKVSNSASGLGSAFDFSTSAHVIIQMMGKDRAKVEMYPTFSIKVGCAFDFTDYPYDLNKCAINLFSTSTMADVQLQNLYAIPPTLSFGWEEQKMKRIISDFKIQNVSSSALYYTNGNITSSAPITGFDLGSTWSMLAVTVSFVRHSPLFEAAVVTPCIVVASLISMTFFIDSLSSTFLLMMLHFYVQLIFLHDLVEKLPLSVSEIPFCIKLIGILMYTNGLTLVLHSSLLCGSYYKCPVPQQLNKIFVIEEYIPNTFKEKVQIKKEESNKSWRDLMKLIRPIIGFVLIILLICMFFVCLLL